MGIPKEGVRSSFKNETLRGKIGQMGNLCILYSE